MKEPIFAPDGSLTFVFEPDASAKSFILDLFDPAGTLVTNQSSGVRSLGTLNAEKVEIAKGTVEIPEIADSYSPAGRTLTRTQGAALPSAEEFVNTNGLPQGTTYSFVNRPSTANIGSFDFQVKVAYSDGSEDLVDATLVVTAKQTMADLNTPEGRTIVIPSGATTDAKDGIYNATDLPAGTTFEWKGGLDTSKPRTFDQVITVKYPDGSSEEVTIKVIVTAAADRLEPQGQPQTVFVGATPDAAGHVTNMNQLGGATVAYATAPNTSTVGEKNVTVVVTYKDGSQDRFNTTVTVVNKPTIADNTTIKGNDQTVEYGVKPLAKNNVENFDSIANVKTVEYLSAPPACPGTYDVTVVVTYTDNSVDRVNGKVTVKPASDKYTPVAREVEVDNGAALPGADTVITNKDDLPNGTTYEWGVKPGTTEPGKRPGTIIVTYPDGSKDTVNVTVTVGEKPDNQVYTPGRTSPLA